uniref:Uncharacterized protein LOC105050112 isoform X2 n=1 Tax=Elaeis guineensis var. tenera TaxID=51953 RepID=A0A6J0PM56_ELAGV|nr:uncharacterized protein LOC105050112 isoform X2 [Elaeis guineensis]
MERILEDEVFRMNQKIRGASVWPGGINSVEEFSQKQRSGKEPRKQKGVLNIGTRGRNWEDVSEAKAMVHYKKVNRVGVGRATRKMKAQPDSFNRIQYKLQSLEEDMWLLKKVFLRRVEERAVLMKEVVQQFHRITELLGDLKTNSKSLGDHSFAIPHKKQWLCICRWEAKKLAYQKYCTKI